MKDPLFIRPLTTDEERAIRAGSGSRDPFMRRRCQILLANARGVTAPKIAASLGCATQTAINALNAFAAEGLACLVAKSHRPKSTRSLIEGAAAERVRALLRRSPREFGRQSGCWTLASLAEVAFEQGLVERAVSEQTIRQAIKRMGGDWKRERGWELWLDRGQEFAAVS